MEKKEFVTAFDSHRLCCGVPYRVTFSYHQGLPKTEIFEYCGGGFVDDDGRYIGHGIWCKDDVYLKDGKDLEVIVVDYEKEHDRERLEFRWQEDVVAYRRERAKAEMERIRYQAFLRHLTATRPVVIYHYFNPPYTEKDAVDAMVVSRKEFAHHYDRERRVLTKEYGDVRVFQVVLEPTLDEVERAMELSQQNDYILSNV
jgi:hypothetical protein